MNRLTKFFLIALLLSLSLFAALSYIKKFMRQSNDTTEIDGLMLIYEYEAEHGEE